MKTLAEEEGMFAESSRRLKTARGRENTGQGLLLRLSGAMAAALVAVLLLLGAAQPAQAQVESVIYNFSNGAWPQAGLVMDSSGNLYGTTSGAGSFSKGTVFELVYDSSTHSYTEKVLFSFNGTDGASPIGALIMDSSGNLYGTTSGGGTGPGTVFELSPPTTTGGSWTENVLYDFLGGTGDGANPQAALVMDSSGNLYGTTLHAGSSSKGSVFELVYDSSTHSYTEKVLFSFNGTDGANPTGALIMDSSGNLYGTASAGGTGWDSTSQYSTGDGLVFKLSPPTTTGGSWTENVLHKFSILDGSTPKAGLIMDSSGNLYGTCWSSWISSSSSPGYGNVFELYPDTTSTTGYTEKTLYTFSDSRIGANPRADLIRDSKGNLYSTTAFGDPANHGTAFELYPDTTSTTGYTEKVLHGFAGTLDGQNPYGALVMDKSGNLYSTTYFGGSNYGQGTAFGIAPVTLSASSLDFGAVLAGTKSTAQTVTITSYGTTALSFGSASISGTNASDFTIGSTDTCSDQTVASGSSCSVSVNFTPSTTGTAETASLNINEAGITVKVGLTGTGITVTADLSSTSLSFPDTLVGSTSNPMTVTLSNTSSDSSATLDISSISASANFAVDSGTTTCGSTLAANSSCDIGVTFSPPTATSLTGTLTISDNAGNGSQTVNLSGTGVSVTAGLSSTSLSFPDTLVGTSSVAETVTITNTSSGSDTLNISSFAVSGTTFAVDSKTTTCTTSTSLAANSSCDIGVIFSPTTAGSQSATLTISDNTAAGSESVGLSGNGVQPTATLSPTSLSFPDTLVGTTSTSQTVTLTNTNTNTAAVLNIGNITFSNTTFALDSTTTTCKANSSLDGGKSCNIGVVFKPTATGSQSATLTVSDNTSGGSEIVNLSGNGVQPTVSLSPTSLSFPDTLVGTTSTSQTVTLTNTNTATAAVLEISSIAVSNTNFTKTSTTCGSSLAAGHSCTISVALKPTTAGSQSGTLTISDNTAAGSETVSLSGNGVQPTATLSPNLTFPDTLVGTTSTSQTVTLTNTNTDTAAVLNISSIAVSSANFTKTSTTCGTTLAANTSCTIDVAFSPTTTGSLTGTLTISDNTASGSQSVSLSGNGWTTVGYLGTYMVNQVESLGLKNGQTNSLVKELDQAAKMISQGKINGAIDNLRQFIAEVNDLYSSGKLTQQDATTLISEANAVINAL